MGRGRGCSETWRRAVQGDYLHQMLDGVLRVRHIRQEQLRRPSFVDATDVGCLRYSSADRSMMHEVAVSDRGVTGGTVVQVRLENPHQSRLDSALWSRSAECGSCESPMFPGLRSALE